MDSFGVFLLTLYIIIVPSVLFAIVRLIIVIYRKWFHTYNCEGLLADKRIEESTYNTFRGSTSVLVRYVAEIEFSDGTSKNVGVDLSIFDDLVVGSYYSFEIESGQLNGFS
jgi:hypothetical protein